jgi:hypothetical protein
MERELIVRRRRVGPEEVAQIRQLIAEEGWRGRSHVSSRLCEIWDWRQANGRYRQIACRDLLRQLEFKGLIELPPMLHAARRAGYVNRVAALEWSDRVPLHADLRSVRDEIRVELAQEEQTIGLFNRLVGAGHYLGYQQPTGAQLKYLAWRNDGPVGCVSFGPAAFKVAPRDQFIGWTSELRQQRLDWLANNDRFLILPWVQVRGLASFVLSQCLRRLRADWQQVYHHDLALAETFIEQGRFTGGCYAAANWRCVGQTQGRGRNDRFCQAALPVKTVWLYPLRTDFREVLCVQA